MIFFVCVWGGGVFRIVPCETSQKACAFRHWCHEHGARFPSESEDAVWDSQQPVSEPGKHAAKTKQWEPQPLP